MDLWESDGNDAGWLVVGGIFFMLQLLMQVFGLLLNLYVYRLVLQALRKQNGGHSGNPVAGSSRSAFVLDLVIWIVLGYLFTFIPWLGRSAFLNASLFGGLYFALINLTFWYHDSGFRNYQLRPLQKIIPQLLLFLVIHYGSYGLNLTSFGKVSLLLYYLLYPVLFAGLAGIMVWRNTRSFVDANAVG